jgi:hypothetical protein
MDIYLLIDGQQQGPYTEEQVRQSLAEGLIPSDLPGWHEGLDDWVQVGSLARFQESSVSSPQEFAKPSPEPSVTQPPAISEPEQSSSASSPNRRKSRTRIYLAAGFATICILALIGIGIARALRAPAPNMSETISNSDSGGVDRGVSTPNRSDVTPEEARSWLKQAIESFGGGSVTSFANPLHSTDVTTITSYQDVSFERDILSIYVHQSVNEDSQYYTLKINLSAVMPESFWYRQAPECSMKDLFATEPKTYYDIVFASKWKQQAIYSPDNVDVKTFNIEIKDEQNAKRIVKALNFLTKQTKAEPF